MTQPDTKTRLLDAAEHLFSEQGFASTSLRAITTQAKANLAAANYHFGSKEALLSAVLERKLHPLNQQRSDRIDQVLAAATEAGKTPATEDLVRAFVEPTFAFRRAKSDSNEFINIVGRAMTSADPIVRDLFFALVQPLFIKLHQALCLALPQQPPKLISARLFFTMGAMGHCICSSGIAKIFTEHSDSTHEDDEFMTNNLIHFVTAGLEASC